MKNVLTLFSDVLIALNGLTPQIGILSNHLKQGVQSPLNRPNFDPELLWNYRPVTNLRFLSKTFEWTALEQIHLYVESNNLTSK